MCHATAQAVTKNTLTQQRAGEVGGLLIIILVCRDFFVQTALTTLATMHIKNQIILLHIQ
jgi:hypothetical protein